MTTQCTADRLDFKRLASRRVTAHFDGGDITSDGGVLLLRELEEKHRVIARAVECFCDWRDQTRVEHSLEELLRQRVFGLALGYEDLNDRYQLPKGATHIGKRAMSGRYACRDGCSSRAGAVDSNGRRPSTARISCRGKYLVGRAVRRADLRGSEVLNGLKSGHRGGRRAQMCVAR